MRLNIKKCHRGFTSLFEAVACVALVGILIVVLLTLVSSTVAVTGESQQTVNDKLNADFLIEMLQTDVKSSSLIEITDNQLQLVVGNRIILYRVHDDILYRNDEVALTKIKSCSFIPADGNSVGIYISHGRDEIIDLMLSR